MAKTFNFNSTYLIDKPVNKRKASYDKWWMFSVKERNGNNITFSSRDRYDLKEYKGKILVNPKTGDEISFITISMHKYMLDAKEFISKGRKLSEMSQKEKQSLLGLKVEGEWNEEKGDFVKTDGCGTTLKEFLEKKANKNKQ
jgi:hypothetical protein